MANSDADSPSRHPRHAGALRITCRDLVELNDFTLNLSQAGMFIATEHAFEPGEQIEVEVSFPSLVKPMRLRAEVVWRRVRESLADQKPPGVGVALRFESNLEQRWFERLIARLESGDRPAPVKGAVRRFRVLLAEDNPMIQELIAAAIKEEFAGLECEVAVVDEPQSALAMLRQEQFDLVIIELRMCRAGQGELIPALRDRKKNRETGGRAPAVVLAGAGEQASAAIRAAADVILRRPFPAEELFATIRSLGLDVD